ncbi:hypothetical protein CNMCM6106_001567 [Aspergillus hiratsukae]|uniref:Uncharacterized protein n=1 Tax=Aspergillus hiratsukae TaxID=1194566 RepID=A0A8H6Q3R3_9EURO|nr:hypothetical protein CNMCM6106_001567 [Aspergillus hiratsukae]
MESNDFTPTNTKEDDARSRAHQVHLERLRTAGGHTDDRSQPSLPVVHRSFASPSALGLISFATDMFLISMYGLHAKSIATPNVMIGVLVFYGGVCQFIAGIMEFITGNTFGATVFSSYGAFNLSYAMIYLPGSGIMAAYTDSSTGAISPEFSQALAIYLWAWFIVTVLFTIAAVRSSWVLFLDLFFLDICLLLLACGNMVGIDGLLTAGYSLGLIVCFLSSSSSSPDSRDLTRVMAISSGNSLFIAKRLLHDPIPPTEMASCAVAHVVGNVGKPGISLLIAPLELEIRKHDLKRWRFINHYPFDGNPSGGRFEGTSIHLSFTGFEAPVTLESSCYREMEAYYLETKVAMNDEGEWVADLDILRGLADPRLEVRGLEGKKCAHGSTFANLGFEIVSIDCWEEILEPPNQILVLRSGGSWMARLAASASQNTSSSLEDIFFNLDPEKRTTIARALNLHLRWWPKNGLEDNFVSWTSSLLFAIQYIYYRHLTSKDGSNVEEIKLYVIDTTLFPRGTFIRDLDLIDAFWKFDDHPEGKNLKNLRKLRNNPRYYFGEYISQGSLKIADKHQMISAKSLFDRDLLQHLQPKFSNIQSIASPRQKPDWVNEVLRLRRDIWNVTKETLPSAKMLDRLKAVGEIVSNFQPGWRFPLAIYFAALIGPESATQDQGTANDNVFFAYFRFERFYGKGAKERKGFDLANFNVIAPDTMPELKRVRELVREIHKDSQLRQALVGAGMVPPTFGTLAKKFHVTSQQILTFISVLGNISSAQATAYGGMIMSPCFVGIGSSVALAIGGATVCDMFFQGESGRFIGICALALTNGVVG